MRESLFEQQKKKELNYLCEIDKIYNLLTQRFTDTSLFFEISFKESVFCIHWCDFYAALIDIFETNIFRDEYDHMSDLIETSIRYNAKLTLNSFLNYLELFKTLADCESAKKYYDSNAKQIIAIVEYDCDKLGYRFIFDNETKTYKTALKHPEAEAVALSSTESIRNKIYCYLSIRPGQVEEKRKCIKSLADDVESLRNKYNGSKDYDKLKQFIQCVRHTKDTPKKEFPFYYKNEEKWLDQTFEMIIGVLAFAKTKDIVKEIIDLENQK